MQSTNPADVLAQIRVHGAVPRHVMSLLEAYVALYLSAVLWPDFTRADLFDAMCDLQLRERRFGRVPA